MLTHGQMIHNARTIALTAGIHRERALALIPLSHMYGQIVPLLYGLVTGSQLTFLPALTPSGPDGGDAARPGDGDHGGPAAAQAAHGRNRGRGDPRGTARPAPPGPPDRPAPADPRPPPPVPLGPRRASAASSGRSPAAGPACRPTSSSPGKRSGSSSSRATARPSARRSPGTPGAPRRPGHRRTAVGRDGGPDRTGRRAHRPGAQRHAGLLGQARADRRDARRRLGAHRRRRRDRPARRARRPRPDPRPDRAAERAQGLPRGRRGGDRRGRHGPGRGRLRGEPRPARGGPPAGRRHARPTPTSTPRWSARTTPSRRTSGSDAGSAGRSPTCPGPTPSRSAERRCWPGTPRRPPWDRRRIDAGGRCGRRPGERRTGDRIGHLARWQVTSAAGRRCHEDRPHLVRGGRSRRSSTWSRGSWPSRAVTRPGRSAPSTTPRGARLRLARTGRAGDPDRGRLRVLARRLRHRRRRRPLRAGPDRRRPTRRRAAARAAAAGPIRPAGQDDPSLARSARDGSGRAR